MMLTKDHIVGVMPNVTKENLDKFAFPLADAMEQYDIDTPMRMAHFLAQIAHESGSLRYTKELASGEAYEGRVDLGNIDVGDGVKFVGRGIIQITGRNNYTTLSEEFAVRLTDHPELLEGPVYASLSAAWFWKWRGLNEIADKPEGWGTMWRKKTLNKFEYITLKINGGFNNIDDRLRYFNNAKKVFGI